MAEPNDFRPKEVQLTPAMIRILGLAAMPQHQGAELAIYQWGKLSEAEQGRLAYQYLTKLMSTPNGQAELQRLLGDSGSQVISAYRATAAPQPRQADMPTMPVKDWASRVKPFADKYGVPLPIALTIMSMESGGKGDALGDPVPGDDFNKAGDRAQGLFQVMPEHFRAAGIPEALWRDADVNIDMAMRVLSEKYGATGDWAGAIKAYNGSGPEAEAYGTTFADRYPAFADAGEPEPPPGGGGTAPSGAPPTRFKADIIGQKDPWARYEEATNQLAMMPWEKKYRLDDKGQPVVDEASGRYTLSPEALVLQELAGQSLDMARYGPKATGQNDIDAWVEGFKKYTGRNPTEQELLQKFGVGGGGDSTAAGNLALNRDIFGYNKEQDALKRQDDLQKERNAIMKAKAEAENYIAQLESQGQRDYLKASEWMIPAGQPVPKSPDFPGLPGLDLNQYLVRSPDFQAPAKTARERIMQQLAGMKVGE